MLRQTDNYARCTAYIKREAVFIQFKLVICSFINNTIVIISGYVQSKMSPKIIVNYKIICLFYFCVLSENSREDNKDILHKPQDSHLS